MSCEYQFSKRQKYEPKETFMEVGFYPGCSLTGTAREYNESVKALAEVFNIKLVEVDGWNCCGATAAHSVGGSNLSVALPARILSLAEQQGFSDLLVPCASCYNRLLRTQRALLRDDALCERIKTEIGLPYTGKVRVLNVIQFMNEYLKPSMSEHAVTPFSHTVACYYGCLLVRPHGEVGFDRVEDPRSMEEWLRLVGAEPLEWAFKTECCGAGLSVARTDLVAKLSGRILSDAVERGAEAVVVACPMCHSNLDLRRPEINRQLPRPITVPVLYLTQIVGLSLGLSARKLGLHRHLVSTESVVGKIE